jgi:Uma2 family endonuclease
MLVREKTYEELALTEEGKLLELHDGVLREKPAMSFGHNQSLGELARSLFLQCDRSRYVVRVNSSRVHRPERTYFIPDLAVIPVELTERYRTRERELEVYDQPLPLVVEIWSPSTGDYDIDAKLPDYRRRGDQEIWRLHPFERTLTVWRRQPDGSYQRYLFTGGMVEPVALPGVVIDLDAVVAL